MPARKARCQPLRVTFAPRPTLAAGLSAAVALAAAAAATLAAPAVVAAHGVGESPDPPTLAGILTDWSWDPTVVVALLASAAVYLWLVRRVDREHPDNPWPRRRTLYFLGAMVTLAVAILSPIDSLSDSLATVHMLQHMLLIMGAPPLLAASGPATLLLRASTRRVRDRWLLPALHSRILSAITFPAVGWLALVVVMWGTHYGPIYNQALLDPNVHVAEHLAYLAAASLFWWPVYSPDPLRWRLPTPAKALYILLQLPQMSFLAASILAANHLLYTAYAGRSLIYGIDAFADQQASAAFMWVTGDMMFIMAMLGVVAIWMREEETATKREDARLDRLDRLAAGRARSAAGPRDAVLEYVEPEAREVVAGE